MGSFLIHATWSKEIILGNAEYIMLYVLQTFPDFKMAFMIVDSHIWSGIHTQ